ncbi:scavenger receptor cysteine-rich domain-containing protein DMBT1-like [Babylonia areolata]|uniref:scavenger receptor cysteine-rich domain-containing protein DMBT1-like n=1 Tax=Babylonia areolata TaxID=304850 RepID=UPI003FD674A5
MGWWCGCAVLIISAAFQVVTGQGQGVVIEAIRLAGRNRTAGRVEVQVNGVYGTVCDDQWDDKDATVVCRQLGLTGGKALTRAFYGEGTGTVFLDDVDCKGDEKSLADCYFSTGSAVNCDHSEDASVVCQSAGAPTTPTPLSTTTISGQPQPSNCSNGVNPNSGVVLVGSRPGVGYVQVRAGNGTFGFVCDDGWDTNAAKVVCRESCYDVSLAEPGMKQEFRVSVPGPVVFAMDEVQCVGTEASLVDCGHDTWFQHDCVASELAAVTCVTVDYPTPEPPTPDLQCREGDLIAAFSKSRDPSLEPKHLKLLVNCTKLVKDDSDPNFITVRIPFNDCGTEVRVNETHIIYNNTIMMESTKIESGSITRSNVYMIELTCEMPRNATVDREVEPLTETVTQKAQGEFVVTMTIYTDNKFSVPTTVYPYQLVLGDWLDAGIELDNKDDRLKLVVTDCVASPNFSDPNPVTVDLLKDKCVADPNTLEVYPLSKVKIGLRLQSFIFVNHPIVILQCSAIVCLTSEVTAECDRTCNNSKPAVSGSGSGSGGGSGGKRRRRDVSDAGSGVSGGKTVYTVRSLPVVLVVPPITGPTAPSPSTTPFTTTTTNTTTRTPPTQTTPSMKTTTARSETANASATTTTTTTTPKTTTTTTPTTTTTTPTTTTTTPNHHHHS